MNKPRLFHISEEPGITVFEPRPAKSSHNRPEEDVVWAVAEAGLYNYLLPRNCPRVSFFATDTTREEDVERFLDGDRAKKVLAVESGWLERILGAVLIQYEFAPDQFYHHDGTASYYLSQQAEVPIAVHTITNPLRRLSAGGIEVRLTPSLWELRERVLHSSLGFSFIRMRHASPPPAGSAAYHPL